MAHKVETMAYNKVEVPWHGLGYPVEGDLSPAQMCKAAKLDWTVHKVDTFYTSPVERVVFGENGLPVLDKDGKVKMEYPICQADLYPLIRSSDGSCLGNVTAGWNPVQNEEAFDFFNQYVEAGEMSMETAGSLEDGQIVWALAKINESFDVLRKKDRVSAYMLFTNPHKYGFSLSVSFTAIRVVCWNTLTASLNSTKKDRILRMNHSKKFVAEEAKEILEISKNKLGEYKERAQFLANTKAKDEDVVDYFKRIFPVITDKEDSTKEISKSAAACHSILETQPGADLAPGTWWNAFNAITYHQDHLAGQNDADAPARRLYKSWYGEARLLKKRALNVACEMAEAS